MLLFDLDGTLIDSNGVWAQIDQEFLAERGFRCPPDYSAAVAGMTYPEAAEYTCSRFHLEETPEEIQNVWLSMAVGQYGSQIPLKEGVLEFLHGHAALGTPMGIVTSCMRPLCNAVLSRHGILDLFCQVTTADQVSRGKAYPDIYLYAARQAGISPEDCVVFEDSPVAASGARAAGMDVVGVSDPYFADRQQKLRQISRRYIRSFKELTPGQPLF